MAIAFVNAASSADVGAVSSFTITVSFTAGNCAVVAVSIRAATGTGPTVSSVTDNGGSTYTFRAALSESTLVARNEIWSTSPTGITGSPTTITVTLTAAPSLGTTGSAAQYSGVVAIGASGTNGGNSTTPTISLTTQDNNNWVAAGFAVRSHGAITANVGNLRTSIVSAQVSTALNDNTAASPSSVTNTITDGGPNVWAATAVELRSTAGGAVVLHTLPMMGAGQ